MQVTITGNQLIKTICFDLIWPSSTEFFVYNLSDLVILIFDQLTSESFHTINYCDQSLLYQININYSHTTYCWSVRTTTIIFHWPTAIFLRFVVKKGSQISNFIFLNPKKAPPLLEWRIVAYFAWYIIPKMRLVGVMKQWKKRTETLVIICNLPLASLEIDHGLL